jgi:hypothetical protein
MTDFTPAELSRGSQLAAAFLAQHATSDERGTETVLQNLAPLSREVQVFIFALALVATRQGVARLGREQYVNDLRAMAAARAGDDA